MRTPEEWARLLAYDIGLHCGDFPAAWAREAEEKIARVIRDATREQRDALLREVVISQLGATHGKP